METNGCIFFEWVNDSYSWVSNCRLMRTYCNCERDCEKCKSHVHVSDKSKIAEILKICIDNVQLK